MDAKKYFERELAKPTFGRSLRAWRLGEELSQEQLAKKTGLTKAAISRFENGHDFPSSETLEALAKPTQVFGSCISLVKWLRKKGSTVSKFGARRLSDEQDAY